MNTATSTQEDLSRLFSIGADFNMAPLSLREIISIPNEAAPDFLKHLSKFAQEAAIVSTCNRTEIYCITDRPNEIAKSLAGNSKNQLFQIHAKDAVRRAFCVASGLESQIIGEPEITGQIKRAAQIARDAGASGVFVNRLLEKSLAAAKAVRTQTDIGRHSLSYCGLVARAAAGIFPQLKGVSVLLVGTGDMARSGATLFAGRGAGKITIAGRSLPKAEAIAAPVNGEAVILAQLPNILGDYDIIISATASAVPVIGKGAVEQALKRRRHRPMVFADLGLPHDLEPEIADMPDVFVYTLSQLGKLAEQSQAGRSEAAENAHIIIARHVEEFCKWWAFRKHAPAQAVMRRNAEDLRQEETRRALALLQRGENPEQVVEEMSRRLLGKLLHPRSDDEGDN